MSKKKDNPEVSQDWFEDHETYEEDDEGEEESSWESLEELEEIIEDDETFNSRLRNFLMTQQKDVSLENMLEVPITNLEEDLKVSQPIEDKEEEKIEYTSSKDDEPGKEYEVKINKDLLPPKLLKQEEDRILEEQRKSRMYAEKMTAPDKEIVEAEKEIQEDYKEKKYEKR